MHDSVSFIMAGYNESKIASKAIDRVLQVLENSHLDYELILVDDGSKDDTLSIMRSYACHPRVKVLENYVNLNYGSAVLRGMAAASKEWVFYDAFDLEMDPQAFVDSFSALDDALDLVVYRRETYGAVAWRQVTSLGNRFMLNLLYPKLMRGTPVLNHVQLFRRRQLPDILPLARSPIFFAPELVFRAKLAGWRWKDETVPFNSIDGVRPGHFGHLHDILWGVHDMLRFRWHLWRGKGIIKG